MVDGTLVPASIPDVEIPSETPTELVVTEITPGSGPKAVNGDMVLVNYVGVRSEDGTQFDTNYGGGPPFPVTLGAGGVIEGWDQGLQGVQAGERLQLDIPADLAYGDQPQGDVIKTRPTSRPPTNPPPSSSSRTSSPVTAPSSPQATPPSSTWPRREPTLARSSRARGRPASRSPSSSPTDRSSPPWSRSSRG